MTGPYDDIIDLPHPVSAKHKRMSMIDRAAQFSPFAALVGYEDAIEETARLTGQRIELDESEKYLLDIRQQRLIGILPQMPQVTVTFFSPDEKKEGGSYITVTGRLKNILVHADMMVLADGMSISLHDIVHLDSPSLDDEI